jgi:hypothetical protein
MLFTSPIELIPLNPLHIAIRPRADPAASKLIPSSTDEYPHTLCMVTSET